jgi:glycerol-3-phosphate acyltransferase PlsY
MDWILNGLLVFSSYGIGNIPFGLWVTRDRGPSALVSKGSGNIGATNVLRVFGKRAALLTLLGDIGKGILAVGLTRLWTVSVEWQAASALAVVLGHVYPVFRKGKGGKGVATGFGVLIVLNIWVAFFTFLIWILTVAIWRYSSLGALVSFGLLPVLVIGFTPKQPLIIFSILLFLIILIRHWENARRLWSGEEPRMGTPS